MFIFDENKETLVNRDYIDLIQVDTIKNNDIIKYAVKAYFTRDGWVILSTHDNIDAAHAYIRELGQAWDVD